MQKRLLLLDTERHLAATETWRGMLGPKGRLRFALAQRIWSAVGRCRVILGRIISFGLRRKRETEKSFKGKRRWELDMFHGASCFVCVCLHPNLAFLLENSLLLVMGALMGTTR
ncbi:hypothetical protein Vadar_010110 [Vaccinium darrowii]|uniref:Uncharacterized protein n=1 Tax=Vaccinium darrowii TaxID=229202 RepID=A0ACB7WZA5_9ERIC|nr:hypothetical protein Vadar_010110 [Vaccinium darrowii]